MKSKSIKLLTTKNIKLIRNDSVPVKMALKANINNSKTGDNKDNHVINENKNIKDIRNKSAKQKRSNTLINKVRKNFS